MTGRHVWLLLSWGVVGAAWPGTADTARLGGSWDAGAVGTAGICPKAGDESGSKSMVGSWTGPIMPVTHAASPLWAARRVVVWSAVGQRAEVGLVLDGEGQGAGAVARGRGPGEPGARSAARQPRLGACTTVVEPRATRPGTATASPAGRSPSAAISSVTSASSADSRRSTGPGALCRFVAPTAALARTRPRRSTAHTARWSTPISAPIPAGPRSLTASSLPGRPRPPVAARAVSTSSPARSSSSASGATPARVSPIRAATAGRESGPCAATVRSTRARLRRRMPCWVSPPGAVTGFSSG